MRSDAGDRDGRSFRQLAAQQACVRRGTPKRVLSNLDANRKKKAVHKTTSTDDKRLQNTLKRLGVNTIPGIEEVNIFKDDSVIHFTNPKGEAARIDEQHFRSCPGCFPSPFGSHKAPPSPSSPSLHRREHLRCLWAVADEECVPQQPAPTLRLSAISPRDLVMLTRRNAIARRRAPRPSSGDHQPAWAGLSPEPDQPEEAGREGGAHSRPLPSRTCRRNTIIATVAGEPRFCGRPALRGEEEPDVPAPCLPTCSRRRALLGTFRRLRLLTLRSKHCGRRVPRPRRGQRSGLSRFVQGGIDGRSRRSVWLAAGMFLVIGP